MTTRVKGQSAEDLAAKYLENRGYEIKARNIHYKMAELDIVAYKNQMLCFVEVRSKSSTHYGTPEQTVHHHKQTKIIQASQIYLKQHYTTLPYCRFDVISIVGYGKEAIIKHIPNAFEMTYSIKPYRKTYQNPWKM